MPCARCGADNAPDRRFCGGCGVPLGGRCPGCGFANDPGARFCGGCGVSLAGQEAGGASPQGQPDLAPERRQVAVLFVDLVGYTRLTGELGAEHVLPLLEGFFAAVDEVVTRFGGTVDKHIGDCVMALFGAPLARGDDAERAVRAALAVREAMAGLSARLDRGLEVHMGVAGGEVVAGGVGSEGHRSYTVTGETVNLAARLTGLAAPGEVLVSDAVRLALGARVLLEDRGEATLRGIARPVRVFALLGLAEAEGPGRLVGRQAELQQLAGFLDRSRALAREALVLVRGEAGIGKTRLLVELRPLARTQGFACRTVPVLDFGSGEGCQAVRVLIRKLLGADTADARAREAAAAAALEAGTVEPSLWPFLLDLLGLPLPPDARTLVGAMEEGQRRRARQETAVAVVRARAKEQPLLLVVEDLHWADQDTLEDLAALAGAIQKLPVVLVLTTRPESDPIDSTWRARAGGAPLTTIDLSPLGEPEARLLAGQILAGEPDRTIERCVARAQGNPLFLEQLLRHVRERQDDAVPGTVQSLVQARLDRLAPADREALRAASVLGQRFTLEALRAVAQQPGCDPGQLVRRFLVRPTGDGYVFAHALIQEAVHDLLLQAQRRGLHRRAASFFAGRDAVLHARHLDRAADPAAPAAYAAAAEQQTAAYRNEAALDLAARGLELATEPGERQALACLTGQLLLDLGRVPMALDRFGQALELARDDAERCRALLGLAAAMRLADRLDEAVARLDEAEAAASRLAAAAELSRIHHLRGNLLFPLGRVEDCAEAHGEALVLAREAGSPELEARALGGLGDAEYARGRMLSAHEAFTRCCALAARHGFGRIEAANLPMVAVTSWYTLDLPAMLREADAAIALAMRVGHLRGAIIAQHAAILALLLRADLDEAEARIAEAQRLTAEIGARRFEAENLMFLAERMLLGGGRDAAAAIAEEAMVISRETAVTYIGPCVLGFIAWASREAEARRAAVAESEAMLAQGAISHNFLMFRRYAIEAAIDAGAWDEVEHHAAELERYAAAEPSPWSAFFVARGRVLAAHGRTPGDPALRQELARVRDEAQLLGLGVALPALDAAIAAG
jgi:class 3 adenylate cyclase/tetratricopeptide (TPR) repeat protein